MIRYFTVCVFLIFSYHAVAQYTLDDIITEYEAFEKKESVLIQTSWPNYSGEKVKGKQALFGRWISNLNKLEIDTMSELNQINYEMLQFILEDKFHSLTSQSYLMPLNSEGGFIIGMLYATRGLQLNSKEAIENYSDKLKDCPRYINSKIDDLKAGQKLGIEVPKLVVENCIAVLDDILKVDNESFFLFVPLKENKQTLTSEELNVRNAFVNLKKYLESDYLPKTRSEIGIKNNSNGKAYYEQRVRYFTTYDMSPQEVFDVGQAEVARIKKEMEAIIRELKYEGSFNEFLEFLRTDPQFYAKTPEELLKHAAWLSKKAEEILPSYFTVLPRLPFTVTPVPEAIAPNYTTGRYSGGSFDRKKAGAYWVNTYNLPSRPLYVLPSLTLHEAVPGHHLQISLANEMKAELPNFRSSYLSAYGEGWGLYAEFLGKEAGIYTTPYEDFGRLTYEMWRACRLVVDPGMHYFDWTREEAIQFMKKNTALSMHEINTEINRYIGWPAQAVSYKIGELKIRELRAHAEKELGELFDIRYFHDRILANGSIPLNTLERIVNKFIKETKENAKKN